MYRKLKSYLHDDTIFIASLIILIGVISFGLGRQSVLSNKSLTNKAENASGIVFYDLCKENGLSEQSHTSDLNTETLKIVASKTGTKYHLPSCPGASQIKEANKIYFNSIELAEAAGYKPAANCPALQ